MKVEVHDKPPKDFSPRIEVSACYLEIGEKVLFLETTPNKKEAGKWGVPAGKLEKGETPEEGARRELLEETGIDLTPSHPVHFVASLYIRKPEIDYVYHLFRVDLIEEPAVHLSDEHQSYQWFTLKELENVPLMDGARAALDYFLERRFL